MVPPEPGCCLTRTRIPTEKSHLWWTHSLDTITVWNKIFNFIFVFLCRFWCMISAEKNPLYNQRYPVHTWLHLIQSWKCVCCTQALSSVPPSTCFTHQEHLVIHLSQVYTLLLLVNVINECGELLNALRVPKLVNAKLIQLVFLWRLHQSAKILPKYACFRSLLRA